MVQAKARRAYTKACHEGEEYDLGHQLEFDLAVRP